MHFDFPAACETHPDKALRQQPRARLSEQGFAWLNERLQAAFDLHGTIADTKLAGLDWPKLALRR